MNKQLKQLLEMADESGITIQDLMIEKELGARVDKPFTLAIKFVRLRDMVDFAHETICKWDESDPTCVYKADALDDEFSGKGGGNRFVIRSDRDGKAEAQRVSHLDGSIVGDPKWETDTLPDCPRCSHFIPNDMTPGAYPGAISRVDNKTEICSNCGTEEAILQWQGELKDWRK
jgi:hypothetical protein